MRLIAFLLSIISVAWGASPALAEDARNSFPQQYTVSPKGVNVQTGRFMYSKTDISIGDLKFVRQWGSGASFTANSRSLGPLAILSDDVTIGWVAPNVGWSHNFNEGVAYASGNASSSLSRLYVVVGGKQYNYVILTGGSIGPGDQPSQGTSLVSVGGQWVFTDRAGTVYTFFVHPAISQGGATGNPFQLLQSVVYADGTRLDYAYNAAGQPHFITSSKGYAIAIDYDGNGNVSASCGFNLAQTYADASSTCASASIKAGYAYDSTGKNLTSVTDVRGGVVTMSYVNLVPNSTVGYFYPSCISLVNSSTCEISNVYGLQPGLGTQTLTDQVSIQTTATGAVWTYSYVPQPDPVDQPPVAGQPRYSHMTFTDPTGRVFFFKYDRGHLVTHTISANSGSGAGSYTIDYRYPYVQGNLGSSSPMWLWDHYDVLPGMVIPPEGNREFFAHDNRGNLTQHSYWPKGSANPAAPGDPNLAGCCLAWGTPTYPAGSVTYSQTFLGDYATSSWFITGCGAGPVDSKRCDKPISRTDANGNVTDYTYDQATGNLLTETAPAVNGVRAQTRYTYAQRTAWVKNSSGSYSPTASPVWVLTQTSFCKTGAASGSGCANGGDEVRTLYEYGPDSGPNNLLLRGVVQDSLGTALRTCYGYDWQGNRISETKPRAGLASCP